MASVDLRIPVALRDRAAQITDITDAACREHLDEEYGLLVRRLVARLVEVDGFIVDARLLPADCRTKPADVG